MVSRGATNLCKTNNMKNINTTADTINSLEVIFQEQCKKTIRDNSKYVSFHIDFARSILSSLMYAKEEINEINKDQNPADYAHLVA
jgi:hypothetical protein